MEFPAPARVLPARLRVPKLKRSVLALAAVLAFGGLARSGSAPATDVGALALAILVALGAMETRAEGP